MPFTYLANPEVEAKRQRPMKTNADLKINAGSAALFNGEELALLRQGCLTVAQAGLELPAILLPQLPQGWDRCLPRNWLAACELSSTQSPPLCPGARFRGVPRRGARGGERWAPRLQRRHAPAPGYPPAPRPCARTARSQRPPPSRTRRAAPHSLTMAARPRCAVQGSRLPSAPRHAPPALVTRPRPLGRAPPASPPPRARAGPCPLRAVSSAPRRWPSEGTTEWEEPRRGPRGRGPPPEACASPLRARSRRRWRGAPCRPGWDLQAQLAPFAGVWARASITTSDSWRSHLQLLR